MSARFSRGWKPVRRVFIAVAVGLVLAVGAPGGTVSADDDGRGAELFGLCVQCHGADGAGVALARAPSLAGLTDWYVEAQLTKFQQGLRGYHPDDVAGLRMAPMSRMLKSEADIRAVAAYVAGLPAKKPAPQLTGGDAARGKEFFVVCSACHGPDAAGNQQVNAPPLRYASDWYLHNQLEKFRAGLRGTNPGDPIAATMRPMSLTLPDEQALKDVIAYIMTLAE